MKQLRLAVYGGYPIDRYLHSIGLRPESRNASIYIGRFQINQKRMVRGYVDQLTEAGFKTLLTVTSLHRKFKPAKAVRAPKVPLPAPAAPKEPIEFQRALKAKHNAPVRDALIIETRIARAADKAGLRKGPTRDKAPPA